ncbi:DNA glycosylase AlkZ-like family protein [Actinokineospora sp.]|uniref:DNA glycosylase AlkZ-like family protein n=1 Tax=Actinokineospora sp. TaxID=1872133 RepID=UPI0040384767
MDLTRERVLAYRVAAQGLHRDTATATDLAVLDLGIQDGGGRSPRVALAARLPDGAALDDDSLVTVWTFRGAPHLMRRVEVAALAGRLWPRSDADALARLGGSGTVFRKAGLAGLSVFTEGATALRAAVDAEKTRGEVSTEVSHALPAEFSYDCRTCAATHIYGSLFQLVGLAAGVEVRNESRPTLLRPIAGRHRVPRQSSGAGAVIESYLRVHGPATHPPAAGFLETTQTETRPVWPAGLAEVTVEGRPHLFPEAHLDALRAAPEPDLVRLVPPYDPLLQLRDRELLVPDAARRKELWRMIGNPGAVLAGGEIVGTWRTKAAGRRLDLTVTSFHRLPAATRTDIDTEAQRVAAARGLAEAKLTVE